MGMSKKSNSGDDMKIELMNIKRQHETHASEYEEAVLSLLRSGKYIGGEEVSLFEQEFANYNGAKYGVSCGNGTDALVIALRALGIGDGDEVITVSWTFFATAESIAAVGATPVFVDVDKNTYCIDPSLIEKSITSKTKAILPVHFYGQSCDMDSLRKICDKYNLYLITDCAQATGSEYKCERKGILGDISCFSFFPTKNLGCDGDGGMILTNDENIATFCRALKAHGSGKDGLTSFKRFNEANNPSILNEIHLGETKYYNYFVGYNSRLDAIQAALLRRKLSHIDEFIEKRIANADRYNKALEGSAFITPYKPSYSTHSYYLYVLKCDNPKIVMDFLINNGIQCGVYYPVPLHLQAAFHHLGYKKGDLPVTEELANTTFAIPVYPELSNEEIDYICEKLLEASKLL